VHQKSDLILSRDSRLQDQTNGSALHGRLVLMASEPLTHRELGDQWHTVITTWPPGPQQYNKGCHGEAIGLNDDDEMQQHSQVQMINNSMQGGNRSVTSCDAK
jgi:hypothetical protein